MAASSKRRLALDSNILLDLAEAKNFAEEFREEFQARGYELLVLPTVAGELNILSLHVVLSGFHTWLRVVVHGLLLAVVAYLLFRRPAATFFRTGGLRPPLDAEPDIG